MKWNRRVGPNSTGSETTSDAGLPMPPFEMRQLVGPLDDAAFDNPTRHPALPLVGSESYESVLDFGCGCGRLARQMIQQRPQPLRYLGIDVHRGLIDWCQANLTPRAPQFRFAHHDVFNRGLNPEADGRDVLPLPGDAGEFSLAIAWSVFTHLTEVQTLHYLREARRVLRSDGVLLTTWFLFEKADFPMLQPNQNALYVNEVDPSNAVIFDREWLVRTHGSLGLTIVGAIPPITRGNQWLIAATPTRAGLTEVALAPDCAPLGEAWVAPVLQQPAHLVRAPGAADQIRHRNKP